MPKEESGRLFSKVAKFVRNPLKDWSELDAPASASTSDSSLPAQQTYSREMLKEMIERRQRNDFVRRREFDMLRKLRQREAAAHAFEATVTPSSFNINSTSEKSEGRALTLKKIDEIEQQMSQQWWKGRGPNGETLVNPPPDAGAETLPPVHTDDLLSEPAVLPIIPPAAAAEAGDDAPAVAASVPLLSSRLAHDGALEEAVIRFAHSDDTGAEAILLQALASTEGTTPTEGGHDAAAERDDNRWRALFDLYRATGDAAKFAAARMRYAQRMRRMGPDWVSLDELARSVKAVTASEEAAGAAAEGSSAHADWTCPTRLAREGLMELTRALSKAGSVWTLDWRGLHAVEPEAAAPLRVLFTHWADSPVQLRFMGSAQLLAVLSEAAPNNERGTDDIWWQLHLAALRLMHLPDDFELVALNYCITYEVSPPSWQDPKGECTTLAAPPASRPSSVWSLLSVGGDSESFPSTDSGFAALAGDLRGESLSSWQRLDNDLRHTTAPVISCAALLRMDLAAVGTLLSWVRARDANGERVQFVDAHRLIAALFNLVGIADHSTVTVRKN
ncbi:STAS domain-containing protein [Variovorax sp. OV084]|jgi:ABC-type transporter Mla MlaB component|uniref:STAS domain-containing protein n=1 Tax=Variovorax sp. OV084 TaxID=1882777 RepID=UPI0008B53465|nr:STAS domain-containing protein [Variovorax sp. OV084]